jgi:anti-sigma factor RsiW
MRCEEVAALLPELVDTNTRHLSVERHVETCLRCQAELARYRKLLRAMQQLRLHTLEPAPGLIAETLTALAVEGERRAARSALSGRRLAYAGAIGGTAVAAGAATAAVLIARSRTRRLKLAS